VPDSPTEVEAVMLLCDAAQSVGGKLYILGAGWSEVQVPNVPVPMALAIRLTIPWDQANHRFRTRVSLMTQDGEAVDLGEGPVMAEGEIEVGRPPGLERGTSLYAPMALPVGAVALTPGRYVWELEVDGSVLAREPFQVKSAGQR
jgi:hypothetical protein